MIIMTLVTILGCGLVLGLILGMALAEYEKK